MWLHRRNRSEVRDTMINYSDRWYTKLFERLVVLDDCLYCTAWHES
jgi:hypothetical protein